MRSLVRRGVVVGAVAAVVAATGCGRLDFGEYGPNATRDPDGAPGGDGPRLPNPDGGVSGSSPITPVGAGAPTEWAGAFGESQAMGLPPGVEDGDLLVLHAAWHGGSTWTAPTFGAFVDTVPVWTDAKCMGSTAEVLTTIAVGVGMMQAPTAMCTGDCIARISAYRGVDPTTPIDAVGALASTVEACGSRATPQPHAIPGPVTTVPGDELVVLYGDDNTDNVDGLSSANVPAGFTAMYIDVDLDGHNEVQIAGARGAPVVVGGVPAQTVTTTAQTVAGWTGVMLALKPMP